ncbi:MAG: c-type cytochrome biogenesis protein CcsB [Candidatus Binataceae bacterium]
MDSVWIIAALILYALSAGLFFFSRASAKNRLGNFATPVFAAGAITQAIDLVFRGLQAGNLPVANLGESLGFLGFLIALASLVMIIWMRLRIIGIFAAPIVTAALAAAFVMTRETRLVLPASLQSGWLPVHVTLAFLGYALFVLAAGVSIVYLTFESRLKSKRPLAGRGERVPSLEKLDRINYRLLGCGFVMLSLAIVTGAIWADATWGRFWSWEPQELWSAVTWILYAALLESRLTAGWRGRRAAALTILVFTVLLGSFLGINLLHAGHHGGNFD